MGRGARLSRSSDLDNYFRYSIYLLYAIISYAPRTSFAL
jgi:hypothetical protein